MKKNIGMLVVVVLLLAMVGGYAVHSALASTFTQTPSSPEAVLLAEFQQMLGNPSLDADMRRSLEQIIEGVRRQRRHILMLDGVDPLRGGVAD